MPKLWGSRFEKTTDALMERFNASIGFDWRLYDADVRGSIAYAQALERAGLITVEEQTRIVAGLERIRDEFQNGRFELLPADEDIHTAVERRLHEIIGPVAGKLHTGRSRNDQVATDLRLYMLEATGRITGLIRQVQRTIVDRAAAHLGVIMPGYTHLRQAQPVLFSHWLMSYFWMLDRDQRRLTDCVQRTSVLPLGSGALAGNSLGVDREFLASELGFGTISENSMDAVSDRDFVAEFLFCAVLLQVHLSRLAEDLIIYSSPQFGFVTLDQAYATGSSLMPQKVNPDSLELMRGKVGRLTGDLVALLTVLKGLPSTYNKDLQEDKEPVFDAVDTLEMTLPIMAGVVDTLEVNPGAMAAALDDAMLATDLVDYLVRKGVAFRQSHEAVGRLVRHVVGRGSRLSDLSLAEIQAFHQGFAGDVSGVFDFARSVRHKNSFGGTSQTTVEQQIERARRVIG